MSSPTDDGARRLLHDLSPNLPRAVTLGRRPTPLVHCSTLSHDVGVQVYLKREDLIDDLGCGNKTRKLEYFVAQALHRRCTVLVTAGSTPSNQCKALALAASMYGLRAHLVYGGDNQVRPAAATGNYLLANLLRPTISWFERTSWQQIEAAMSTVVAREIARGEQPLAISPGASEWPGILGSIELGIELAMQLESHSTNASHVVVPAGSGGTCSGIAVGLAALRQRASVIGVSIADSATVLRASFEARIADLVQRTRLRRERSSSVIWYDGSTALGYDCPQPTDVEVMSRIARTHGLLFDPNYMLKAYLGLKQLVLGGEIPRNATVVLVHTGGHFGVFGLDSALTGPLRVDSDHTPPATS